ncbi:MAG: acyl-CoA dehydratase activase-related protein [Firmicutes bacterium]|nr:acyl-CoA dehydratase activase-related protein [Bacillota bacterium]
MRLGIDVGSTTVKLILVDENDKIVYQKYERHMSSVFSKVSELLRNLIVAEGDIPVRVVITGSGGLSLADTINARFEQEVVTCSLAVQKLIPQTDVVIELGGEDAKITFFGSTVEQRMNGTCAGGTGAFIDQMAILLNTDADGLNEAAKDYTVIYPIAARCGVFAKTDIQPLINEGAPIENLAASIFQAVVNQTISGLACGHRIKGNVAFLGGPLTYMSELRKRFIETLNLAPEEVIFPENSKYFVALGAAFMADKCEEVNISTIVERIDNVDPLAAASTKRIEPLFRNRQEYEEFKTRHDMAKIKRKPLENCKGALFLGIDAGSTTTKAALIDKDENLVYSYYKNNEGNPLGATRELLSEVYRLMPSGCWIGNTTVTGYGEGLIKAGFNADFGIIETMAHYKAAEEFLPGVDFILDIGGQDMKCMKIKDGAIYNIMLNEACSSGCGSFIETYAKSVDMKVEDFARIGLMSENPVDLGTRCTVFMNSMVKQAQKEGADIGDIAAGLSYSVVKNALYKVIKLRNPEEAGKKIVVQGGTFLNESVLRAIEKVLGKEVVRPDIAGIMGAYGCALNSLANWEEGHRSSLIHAEDLVSFEAGSSNARCAGCENKCMLTITRFNDGTRYTTGNRCEKGDGKKNKTSNLPDLYEYKLHRLFDYEPLSEEEANRGSVAIPRVLNMYEDYPFWFTFFTKLGWRVVLSPMSSKEIYEKGMDTISSDTACYPAKLVHGHIKTLVEMGEKWIFYPCINYEQIEDANAPNHYNCPIVATYPEVIANNMNEIFHEEGVEFTHDFLPYDDDKRLTERLFELLKGRGIKILRSQVKEAVEAARAEQLAFKKDVEAEGRRAVEYAREYGKKIIVLSGRPYHLDTEINHGIDKMIVSYDMVVVSEDSICNNIELPRPIRVLDQWVYHSRLYKAANVVGTMDDAELVQLNSFGCGVDAVTTDEVEEILENSGKLYTVLKIDEGNNLGAIRIRIRSLKAAMEEREKNGIKACHNEKPFERKLFTQEMRKNYTLLVPQMSPIHFQYLEVALRESGYNAVVIPTVDKAAVDEGLKYVNNDACYPTLVTLGKMISALKSGEYDLDRTALIMSQTGGGCRASNYIALLRKALKDLGMEQIPVVSFNMVGLEANPGFKIDIDMGKRLIMAAVYGDLFQRLLYATRPYEDVPGSAEGIMKKYEEAIFQNCKDGKLSTYKKVISQIVAEYDTLPLKNVKKAKVGVVGEILVKYHPDANNNIVDIIEKEGGEAVVLDLIDFFLYGMYSKKFNYEKLSGSYKQYKVNELGITLIEWFRKPLRKALRQSKRFNEPSYIQHTAEEASQIVSIGNQCGEGWLLTGEMIELIKSGATNIACLQPFACLPNHVTGKGMMKAIRERFPEANIVAIDYDPGASNVNQLNRIKLMMSQAHKNMENK